VRGAHSKNDRTGRAGGRWAVGVGWRPGRARTRSRTGQRRVRGPGGDGWGAAGSGRSRVREV
jgi:hypothetical protein